jgi:multidrug transporter EmrE-like cation transporter
MQRLQKSYPIFTYLAYMWLISGFGLGIFCLPGHSRVVISNLPILVLGGIASFTGLYAYNKAISLQPNLGYIEAVSGIRVVITFLVSLILFDAEFQWIQVGLMAGILIGVFLVSDSPRERKDGGTAWILWATISGLLIALVIVSTKIASAGGVSSAAITSVILLIAGIFYIVAARFRRDSLQFQGEMPVLILAVLGTVFGNVSAFSSFAMAPNLAYPVVISNSRIIVLYVISLFTGADSLQPRKAAGVLITTICVAIFSFAF